MLAPITDDDGGETERTITVTVTPTAAAVPEPTTMGGLVLAGAIGAQIRRRVARRKNDRTH